MAEAELQNAAAWYEERSPGLGLRFVLSVHAKADEIAESPQRWPLAAGTCLVLMGRFPYALVYREVAEEIEIVPVAHLHRRPAYWSHR